MNMAAKHVVANPEGAKQSHRELWDCFAGLSGLLAMTISLSPVFAAPQPRTEAKDTTQDGKPDEWRFYEEDKLIRIERDRDGDGKREVRVYFTEGKPSRSEVDRNSDGRPDLVRFMEQGRSVRDQADLNFDDRLDAWTYYKENLKDLMIMDKNYDGQPDAWFYYGQGGTKLIGGRVDENFDGKADRTFGAIPEREERKPW